MFITVNDMMAVYNNRSLFRNGCVSKHSELPEKAAILGLLNVLMPKTCCLERQLTSFYRLWALFVLAYWLGHFIVCLICLESFLRFYGS